MKYFIYIFLFVSFNSCNQNIEQNNSIGRLNWLIGNWKTVADKTTTFEIWTKLNDSTFSGKSFSIYGKDTLFSETISLKQSKNCLFYIPTVKDQNNQKPVKFKFVGCKQGEFIFENREHDFPQRIIYKNPQIDFLCARIEGVQNGKFIKEDFNFVKVK
jgi:hypothetical protein